MMYSDDWEDDTRSPPVVAPTMLMPIDQDGYIRTVGTVANGMLPITPELVVRVARELGYHVTQDADHLMIVLSGIKTPLAANELQAFLSAILAAEEAEQDERLVISLLGKGW